MDANHSHSSSQRLGIPYMLFAYVLSLVLGTIYQSFAGHGATLNPTPNPGPLWFVGWLLVFNYAYACTDHSSPMYGSSSA